jgi:hypothetical protein
MSHRKTLSGLLAAPLVVAAIAAPAATAAPIDAPLRPTTAGAVLKDARQVDMHASTVVKPAAKQDLRSEATIDTTALSPQTHTPAAQQDLRTEAAGGGGSKAPETPVGLPTWPVDPKPIVPVSHEPLAATDGGDGIEWPLSGILLAGALLAGGTLGVAGAKYRVRQSHA